MAPVAERQSATSVAFYSCVCSCCYIQGIQRCYSGMDTADQHVS